jgi:hypothetical protein
MMTAFSGARVTRLAARSLACLLLAVSLSACCAHFPAPYRPADWPRITSAVQALTDPPLEAKLQVFIVYGLLWCHHSAVRLTVPGHSVVFWDPGGSYGVPEPDIVRERDLILARPPDIDAYLKYIWSRSSQELEIFEWPLPASDAEKLRQVLMNGTDKDHPAGPFKTHTLAGRCSLAVSDFLHRFGGKVVSVPRTYFFPHDLARRLYTQSPKRILVFRRDQLPEVIIPP